MISKVSGELANFLKAKILTYPFGSNYGQMKDMLNKAYKGLGKDYENRISALQDDAKLLNLDKKPYSALPWDTEDPFLPPLISNIKAYRQNRRINKLLEYADPYEKMDLNLRQNALSDLGKTNEVFDRLSPKLQQKHLQNLQNESAKYRKLVKDIKQHRLDSYKDLDTAHNDIINSLKDRVQNIERTNANEFKTVHDGYKKQFANDLVMRKEREKTRKDLITKQLDNMHDLEVKDLNNRAELRKQLAGEREYKGPMDWLAKNWQPVAAGGATAAALGAAGWNLHNAINNEDNPSEYMYE